jgi:two-component system nitrate/nitrite response regulator NarL
MMASTPTDHARGTAGSRRPGPTAWTASTWPKLTARETVIIFLMAARHNTMEIAALLDLRPRTVENHKRHIYEKLGVGTQHGAVAQAISHGLLAEPGRQRWPGEPGRSTIVLIRGSAGASRDAVVHALVADEVSFVCVVARESVAHDHWARWHRGSVLSVLVDPEPDDWTWSATVEATAIVVSGTGERTAVVDALAHRASAVIATEDVAVGLIPALRVVAAGLCVMSSLYATALSAWRPQLPVTVPQLTPRERDILGSIALGHTIRQTARTLGIAAKTVENTQARLFRKLGARNRSETLAVALDVGLLDEFTTSRTDENAGKPLFPTGRPSP